MGDLKYSSGPLGGWELASASAAAEGARSHAEGTRAAAALG